MSTKVKLGLVSVVALAGIPALLLCAPPVFANGRTTPGQSFLTMWTWDPLVIIGTLLVGGLYLTGLNRWTRPSHPVNSWQRASFFAGLAVFFLALQSPIDILAEHHFFMHQLQHLLLRMVGPVLLLLGAPLTPMLRGLPIWARQGVVRPIVRNPTTRRVYDFLTNPVVAPVLFLGTMYLWQVPTLHNLSLKNGLVHDGMHATLLFTGILFWWLMIDPKPHRSRIHYGLRMLILGLIVIPNTLLGALITFSGGVIYSAYEEADAIFSMSLLTDQQIGGIIIWIPGDMMSFIAAGIAMAVWFQQEEEKQPQPLALPPTGTVRKPILMQGGGATAQGPRERD